MSQKKNLLIGCAILLYTSWGAPNLLIAWNLAPLERFSFIAWLIWIAPIAIYWFLLPKRLDDTALFHPALLYSALFTTFIGQIISLNTLQYLGFALALAAFLPLTTALVPWIFSSILWMPAFGWIGSRYFENFLLPFRIFLVALASCILIRSLFKNK